MSFRNGPTQSFEDDGATVNVDELSSLVITSVHAPQRPRYAQPAPAQ
jgi:hypothetical protein